MNVNGLGSMSSLHPSDTLESVLAGANKAAAKVIAAVKSDATDRDLGEAMGNFDTWSLKLEELGLGEACAAIIARIESECA